MGVTLLVSVPLSLIGWALFIYALKTEPKGQTTRGQLLPAFLFSCLLAVMVPTIAQAAEQGGDETGVILAADCERWWNEGDYYRYIIHECYLYGK